MKYLLPCLLFAAISYTLGLPSTPPEDDDALVGLIPDVDFVGEQGPFYHGDIVMSEEDMERFRGIKSGVLSDDYKWPKATLIYTLKNGFTNAQRRNIQSAMNLISSKTCIKFRQRRREKNYVELTPDRSFCNSYIGMVGGNQTLKLANGCFYGKGGIIAHELIHALGFDHEQGREDRDDFVRINWENIDQPEIYAHNFNKSEPAEAFSTYGVDYDYASIMHYGATDFGKKDGNGNEMETITVLQEGAQIGQREDLSEKDAAKLNAMYCQK